MPIDLPTEVLQQIVENHLAGGPTKWLKYCSLVCWQWRHVTLPVLMSKVVLTSVWTDHPPGGRLATAQDVQQFAPFLSQYVRHIVVSTASQQLRDDLDLHEANDLFFAMLDVIPDFARLSRMTLSGDAILKILGSGGTRLPNIYHFTVYRTGTTLPTKAIGTFTNLRILHLIGVSFNLNDVSAEWNRDPSELNLPIPVIEELALQLAVNPFVTFVKWACRTKMLDFSQLKILKISMSDSEAERQCFVDELVPLVEKKVETLDADIYNLGRGPVMLPKAPNFPSLVTLRVNLRSHFHGDHLQIEHRKWVPKCLSQFIPSKPLQVVEILPWNLDIFVKHKSLDDPQGTSELDQLWAEADRTLAGCGGLKRFSVYSPRDEVHVHRNPWHPEQLHFLLPISSIKGILHSESNPDLWPGFDVDEVIRPHRCLFP